MMVILLSPIWPSLLRLLSFIITCKHTKKQEKNARSGNNPLFGKRLRADSPLFFRIARRPRSYWNCL